MKQKVAVWLAYIPLVGSLLVMLCPVLPQNVFAGPNSHWIEYRSYLTYEQEWMGFAARILGAPAARTIILTVVWAGAWGLIIWMLKRGRRHSPYSAVFPLAVTVIPGLGAVASSWQAARGYALRDCPGGYLTAGLLALALAGQLAALWIEYRRAG